MNAIKTSIKSKRDYHNSFAINKNPITLFRLFFEMIDRIYNFLWEWRIINHPFWYDFIDIYPVEHLFIHAVNDFFSTTEITSFKDFFFFDPRQTTKGGVISIYISYLKMTKKNTQPTKHWESEQQLTMLRTRHTITTWYK